MTLLVLLLTAAVFAAWFIFLATERQRDAVRDGINSAADFCVNAFNSIRDRIRCARGYCYWMLCTAMGHCSIV